MTSQKLSGRFRDIVAVMIKYGFNDIVDHLEFPGRRYINRKIGHEPDLTTWERVRKGMEELGPTFIKLGQVLSQRADLVPKELITELRKLQDDVPPETFADIRKVLEESFDTPLAQIFSKIEEIPIASASLAQVHQAKFVGDCREIALKIQRPGITEVVQNDMDILEKIAFQLDKRVSYFKVYNLPQLVHRIRQLIMQELDFIHEMHNMQMARAQVQPGEGIVIPEVYPPFCRKQVLAMAFIHGKKMKHVRPESLGDRAALARRGLRFSLKQVLEYGFFHADPHPGNVLVDAEENLILLDWGMTGFLTPRIRYEMIDLLAALVENDVDEITLFLINFTTGREDVDQLLLQSEIMAVTTQFINMPIKEVNMGQLLLDLTSILRTHGRILGTDLSIMVKALITAEETAKTIYPDLNVVKEVEPIVNRLVKERLKAGNLLKGLYKYLRFAMRHQYEFPRHLVNIMSKLDRGKIVIRFRHENLEGLQATIEQAINRLALGIITGALFLGSSMIILADTGPTIWGHPALGVVGYAVAILLILRLAFVRIRSRNKKKDMDKDKAS